MRKLLITSVILILISPAVLADSGMVTVKSAHSVPATLDRLDALLKKKGMTVFSRLNHAKGARGVGIDLRPTELLLFGNPKIGSPLMVCAQSVAIDLPQKALAWEDAKGQVWLSYNAPAYLASRHNIPMQDISMQNNECEKVINKITKALANFAKGATKP